MLAVLLTALMFSQGLSMDSRGTSFITAFPENVAFYFQKTYNLLKITTLHPNTAVSVIEMASGNITNSAAGNNGTILTLNFSKDAEEYQFAFSNKSIRITSDKNITVLSMSGWEGRFQSRVVQPDQNLRTVYQIPALNYTKIAASFNLSVASNVTFLNFRLMIINAVDGDNSVTIKYGDGSGQSQDTIALGPFELFQMQINGSEGEITATDEVAVILTHPCLDTVNCSCNMVVNQLKPQVSDRKVARFPVPSIFGVKQLFVTTNQAFKVCQGVFNDANSIQVQKSVDILPLFPNFLSSALLISTNIGVSLRLISPGLILDLMPTSMFSGCFLVDFNSSRSGALVIANTSSTTGVKMNDQPLNVIWYPLNGTEYSWALVEAQVIGTIWHPNTKIGVYMTQRLDSNIIYGSQAVALNMDLDQNGCLLTPEIFVLGQDSMNWSMSLQYCSDKYDQLATLNAKSAQDKMVLNMSLIQPTLGWIGLRRSLFTTEWYWSNNVNVNFTFWELGQPDKPEKGLCASVALDPSKKFTWQSARCCSENKPVCYSGQKYFIYSRTTKQMLS